MLNLRTEKDSKIRNDHRHIVCAHSISKIGLLFGEIKLKGRLHRPYSVSIGLTSVKDKIHLVNELAANSLTIKSALIV